jgi:DNA mismatch repair protein MutS2
MVDKYLDTANLAGFHTVRLIHGKGTGALRVALWKYLKADRRIASFRIGQYGEGDGGVTVVELK